MSNIYDEAIAKVDWIFSNSKIPHYELRSICVALERAKKVEELLGLYKERSTFIFIPDCNYKDMSIKSLDFKIKQLEEKLR